MTSTLNCVARNYPGSIGWQKILANNNELCRGCQASQAGQLLGISSKMRKTNVFRVELETGILAGHYKRPGYQSLDALI